MRTQTAGFQLPSQRAEGPSTGITLATTKEVPAQGPDELLVGAPRKEFDLLGRPVCSQTLACSQRLQHVKVLP